MTLHHFSHGALTAQDNTLAIDLVLHDVVDAQALTGAVNGRHGYGQGRQASLQAQLASSWLASFARWLALNYGIDCGQAWRERCFQLVCFQVPDIADDTHCTCEGYLNKAG